MAMPSVTELIPILQVAIGPVILISGVGLLLLSMTNRLGRAIDRSRLLCQELRKKTLDERGPILAQLRILEKRADLMLLAIMLAAVSLLLVAVLIITLFLAALLRLDVGWLLALLFISCLIALIGSLIAFIRDVRQTLAALKIELTEVMGKDP